MLAVSAGSGGFFAFGAAMTIPQLMRERAAWTAVRSAGKVG